MPLSNTEKKRHGDSARNNMEEILRSCKENRYIENYVENCRFGRSGYASNDQFLAPFLIKFSDSEKWILYTTTSMRTDRIKGQQWDASNIKAVEPSIKKAYLIYPDGVSEDEKAKFVSQAERYRKETVYSVIDDILSYTEVFNLIEEHALNSIDKGRKKDTQGRNYEHRVAEALSSSDNIRKWKGEKTSAGMYYDLFLKTVKEFGLSAKDVESVFATADSSDIGRLPNNGMPKTDVIVFVKFITNTEEIYTISCKRSSDDSVSIHQYTADAFANVLDEKNGKLRRLLNAFQKAGSKEKFGEENSRELEKALFKYNKKLALWALGGIDGPGNPQRQWANYILIHKNNDGKDEIYKTEDYYQHLKDSDVGGMFGTVFSWTYPSKQRGKYIQLKCKII